MRGPSIRDNSSAEAAWGRHPNTTSMPDQSISSAFTSVGSLYGAKCGQIACIVRSEEHTSELQSLMRNSYAVFCLKKKKTTHSTEPKDNATSNRQYTYS